MDTQAGPGVEQHLMQCMDVFGGNRAQDISVKMPGMTAVIYSRPYGQGRVGADDAGEGGGGDIHYLSSCATGRITRLVIADVSGHGSTVAGAADALRRLMGRFSNYIDQTRFVEAVNQRFGELRAESGAGGTMFATAVVATYFCPTGELSVCLAGHPVPLVRDGAGGRWRVHAEQRGGAGSGPRPAGPSNLPLGVLDDTAYLSTTLRLSPADRVLAYTDALIEAKRQDGRQLGYDGLVEAADRAWAGPEDGFIARLLDEIGRGAEMDDDVTVLLLRPDGGVPRPSLVLGALAGWRIARRAIGSLRRGNLPASFPELKVSSILGSMIDACNRVGKRFG